MIASVSFSHFSGKLGLANCVGFNGKVIFGLVQVTQVSPFSWSMVLVSNESLNIPRFGKS